MDLMYLFQHFNEELPNNLIEFKKQYNKTKINIYDTKLIAEHELFSK